MTTSLTINGIDFNKELDLLLEYIKQKNFEDYLKQKNLYYIKEFGISLYLLDLVTHSSFQQFKQYKLKYPEYESIH